MGWLSDFVSDPVGTTFGTASDIVSGVGDLAGGLVKGVTNTLGNLDFTDPKTLAALGLAAYGYANPELLGLGETAGAAGSDAAAWDTATAGAYGGPEASTALSSGAVGQASNLAAPATTGAMDAMTAGAYGGPASLADSTAAVAGNADKAALFGAEGYGPAASATEMAAYPGTTPSLLSTIASGAKDMGIGLNLPTAMVGSSLYDMYAKNQMAKQLKQRQEAQQAALDKFYAPGTPEYNQLVEGMKRSAVMAGRPIDSAQFAGDIAGKIADKKMGAMSNMASGQNQLIASQLGNQYGGLNTLMNNMAMYTLLKKKGLTE